MGFSIVTPGESGRVEWIDRQHKAAEVDFLEVLADTGRILSPEQFTEKDKKFSQTVQMTLDLAERLESLGISAYSDGDPIQIIGAHSGTIYELPNFRQCNMLPMSAQKKRNPTLNMLLYYTQMKGMKNFRHIVLHKGPRCLITDLKRRYREMKKLFNKWNKQYAAIYDAYFVFYSCEAGSPVKKAKDKVKGTRPYILSSAGRRIRQTDHKGRQTWHPHIHALLEMERYLEKPVFEKMCNDMRRCFGRLEYLFNEPLENTRELCKYMVKCDELMDLKDQDLVDYYHETKGARTIQTMGGFKEFKAKLKDSGRTIRSATNRDTGQKELFPMKNWNRNFARDIQDRTEGEELDKNIRDTIYGPAGPLTSPALISRMAPTHLFCPVAEPAFMVRGRCTDLNEFLSRPKVEKVIEMTLSDFLAGWQDFTNEYGVTFEWWKQQGTLALSIQPETAGKIEGVFAFESTAPKVSAHNTSTTGKAPRPSKPREAVQREKQAASAAPIGPPEAVSSPQSTLKTSTGPQGASYQTQKTGLDGPPVENLEAIHFI